MLQVKEDQHIKEMANIKTRGTASEKRILELEKQLKEEDASFDPTKKVISHIKVSSRMIRKEGRPHQLKKAERMCRRIP